jgi:metal-responsive CopG/Arc/MetJ family transcriptional regulator
MKTAVSIPDPIFRAADRAARRMGISRSQLYQRALSAFLDRHDDSLVTDALNKVYAEQKDTGVDPVLDRIQRLSLPREDW